VLPQGAAVTRHFAFNGYEFYGQDSFKVKPNLTITYGLAMVPVSRRRGRPLDCKLAPNFSLTDFFKGRANNMVAGIPSNVDPLCNST